MGDQTRKRWRCAARAAATLAFAGLTATASAARAHHLQDPASAVLGESGAQEQCPGCAEIRVERRQTKTPCADSLATAPAALRELGAVSGAAAGAHWAYRNGPPPADEAAQ